LLHLRWHHSRHLLRLRRHHPRHLLHLGRHHSWHLHLGWHLRWVLLDPWCVHPRMDVRLRRNLRR
jgi:hypothetical protein